MKIVPVNFNSEHKAMLGHCKMILEDDRGKIAINPDKFDKLITSLRTWSFIITGIAVSMIDIKHASTKS